MFLIQVKNFTFYDVVLDFILMDAFDDLEHPPSSVIAVVNNRWLSNGFKETVRKTLMFVIGVIYNRWLSHGFKAMVRKTLRPL